LGSSYFFFCSRLNQESLFLSRLKSISFFRCDCRQAPLSRLSRVKLNRGIVYVCQPHSSSHSTFMDDPYRKRVAKNVRTYRAKLALSQEALAERADMHWTFISGVERSKYNISLDSLVRIAKALGREPYELLK